MRKPVPQPRSTLTGRRQGLRTPSPDQIYKARDDTVAQVTTILLAFVSTTTFCLLTLSTPDSVLLLGGGEKIAVPFVGPVSFYGFLILGPIVLIVLRGYLQIYVEHSARLDRIARRMPVVRPPTLLPPRNPFIRSFSGFSLYLLLPLTTLLFVWKAAIYPGLEWVPLSLAAGVIASHGMLPLRRITWRSKMLLSLSASIFAAVVLLGVEFPRRPFSLVSANLSAQALVGLYLNSADLRDANLSLANLSYANLSSANLSRANLRSANLNGANLNGADLNSANLNGASLREADLRGANLSRANLRGANLSGANLSGASLSGAHLSDANLGDANLSGADLRGADLNGAINLDVACGDAKTMLPNGLTLKPCSPP